jgi:hypothetical protein
MRDGHAGATAFSIWPTELMAARVIDEKPAKTLSTKPHHTAVAAMKIIDTQALTTTASR